MLAQVVAACIKTDAFADDRDFRMLWIAPADIDQARTFFRTIADAIDQREIGGQQFFVFGQFGNGFF